MDSLENRLHFALAVLKDKDQDAVLILADLLESEGELGMANFLRAKKKSWQKRLDCVIGVLPHLVTLRITCDFLANSLVSLPGIRLGMIGYNFPGNTESLATITEAIQGVSNWVSGDKKESAIPDALRELGRIQPYQFGIYGIEKAAQTLHLAISNSLMAEGTDGNVQEFAYASRNACRKVIKASRQISKQYPKTKYGTYELRDWQFNRAITVIEKTLAISNS